MSSWINYWKNEKDFSDELWEINAKLFMKGVKDFWRLSPDDVVLDIGSGPGNVALKISDQVHEVFAYDISEKYIDRLANLIKHNTNIKLGLIDPNEYWLFDNLGDNSVSKAICFSVIQYYRRKEDLKCLLMEVMRILKPGGSLLLGDIPTTDRLLHDLVGNMINALRYGYLLEELRFILKAYKSEYKKVRDQQGILYYEQEEILSYAHAVGFNSVTQIKSNLSTNKNRLNLLLKK